MQIKNSKKEHAIIDSTDRSRETNPGLINVPLGSGYK